MVLIGVRSNARRQQQVKTLLETELNQIHGYVLLHLD